MGSKDDEALSSQWFVSIPHPKNGVREEMEIRRDEQSHGLGIKRK